MSETQLSRSLVAALVLTSMWRAAPAFSSTPAPNPPLRLVQAISLPDFVKGHFDHFGVDLKRRRLFATAEESGAVLVLDIQTGRLIQTIQGFGQPHAILYRTDLDRLCVTDGSGELKTFKGENYRPGKSVKLLADADSIGFDLSTRLLFIDNGGKDVHKHNSLLSIVDTESLQKVADLSIAGETLEAMALDAYRPRLYLNRSANRLEVLDRWRRTQVASWPLNNAVENVAIALDESHQRLFIGCRSGKLVIFDTNTGTQLQVLPIVDGVDDLVYDAGTQRLYASGDGAVTVYFQIDADHYQSLDSVPTGPVGRTSKLVPELNRYFVAVPATVSTPAKILVFEPVGISIPKPPSNDTKAYTVHAAAAEELVRSTLSSHPFLRKMGLHAIAPGQSVSVIIANGNAMRIGIPTTQGDFEAVRSGTTYSSSLKMVISTT